MSILHLNERIDYQLCKSDLINRLLKRKASHTAELTLTWLAARQEISAVSRCAAMEWLAELTPPATNSCQRIEPTTKKAGVVNKV